MRIAVVAGVAISTAASFAVGWFLSGTLDQGWPAATSDRWIAIQAWAAGTAAISGVTGTLLTILLLLQTQSELRLLVRAERLQHNPLLMATVEYRDLSDLPEGTRVQHEQLLDRFGLHAPAVPLQGKGLVLTLHNVQTDPMGVAGQAGVSLRFRHPAQAQPGRFTVKAGVLLAGQQARFVLAGCKAYPEGVVVEVERAIVRYELHPASPCVAFGTKRLVFEAGAELPRSIAERLTAGDDII